MITTLPTRGRRLLSLALASTTVGVVALTTAASPTRDHRIDLSGQRGLLRPPVGRVAPVRSGRPARRRPAEPD